MKLAQALGLWVHLPSFTLWKLGTWLLLCIGPTGAPIPQNVGINFPW